MVKPTGDNRTPFTKPLTPDEQNLVRGRAYDIWKDRKDNSKSSPNDDWNEAIAQLRAEQTFPGKRLRSFGSRVWRWVGLKDKTPWDVAQVLFVPLALAVAGVALQEFAKQRDVVQQEVTRQREQQLADDKARQETLVKYLGEMSDLLKDGLLNSSLGSELIIIAQTKTIIALQSLDNTRQHLIIQFLAASSLNTLNQYGLLYQARVSRANFRGADLSGSVLIGADLSQANFSCLFPDKFAYSDKQCSNLASADFRGADLSGSVLTGADLSQANFSCLFPDKFAYSDKQCSNLASADFRSADLRGINLESADLNHALLGSPLSWDADLNSNLEGANLKSANLESADLEGAILLNVNLSHADLRRVNFNGAVLSISNPGDPNLNKDTNLNAAILLRADLSTSQGLKLEQLKSSEPPFLCLTKLPAGMENLSDRDCDRLPQELVRRYPHEFKTQEDAKHWIERIREQLISPSGWGNEY